MIPSGDCWDRSSESYAPEELIMTVCQRCPFAHCNCAPEALLIITIAIAIVIAHCYCQCDRIRGALTDTPCLPLGLKQAAEY